MISKDGNGLPADVDGVKILHSSLVLVTKIFCFCFLLITFGCLHLYVLSDRWCFCISLKTDKCRRELKPVSKNKRLTYITKS